MIDIQTLVQRLSRVEHFHGVAPSELEQIIAAGSLHHFAASQVIFVEDDPSSGMYVLLSGRVQLCKLGPQGQISILSVLEPVIMFNEVPALDGDANPVTAICLEDCLVWKLPPADLEALILRHPRIGLGMLRVMARRNRTLVGKFQDLSFRTVLGRTAKLLLDLSEDGSIPIDRRRHPHHQMAARIATVPEAFSRGLKVLRTYGDIQIETRSIRVVNPEHLEQIVQTGLAGGEPPPGS